MKKFFLFYIFLVGYGFQFTGRVKFSLPKTFNIFLKKENLKEKKLSLYQKKKCG